MSHVLTIGKAKKEKDVYQSYLDWEQTVRGQKLISKNRSIEWGKRNFILSGQNTFKLGEFEFTFCDILGYSAASLITLFEERVLKRKRLKFCLDGDGPVFYFVETADSRYGILEEDGDGSHQCFDFSSFSLEKMARQLVIDASLDVYGFCYNSCGGCSLDVEQWLRGKIGKLKRAINYRWPKRHARQSVDEWDMFERSCLERMSFFNKVVAKG